MRDVLTGYTEYQVVRHFDPDRPRVPGSTLPDDLPWTDWMPARDAWYRLHQLRRTAARQLERGERFAYTNWPEHYSLQRRHVSAPQPVAVPPPTRMPVHSPADHPRS